jgi:hypothetical protein
MRERPLNLKRYRKHDVVRHYRTDEIYVVLGGRWRSELLSLLDPKTGEKTLYHPRFLDPCEEAMLVLAAVHAL